MLSNVTKYNTKLIIYFLFHVHNVRNNSYEISKNKLYTKTIRKLKKLANKSI